MSQDEWDSIYKKWKSMEDEKAEKIKLKSEEKKKAEVFTTIILSH